MKLTLRPRIGKGARAPRAKAARGGGDRATRRGARGRRAGARRSSAGRRGAASPATRRRRRSGGAPRRGAPRDVGDDGDGEDPAPARCARGGGHGACVGFRHRWGSSSPRGDPPSSGARGLVRLLALVHSATIGAQNLGRGGGLPSINATDDWPHPCLLSTGRGSHGARPLPRPRAAGLPFGRLAPCPPPRRGRGPRARLRARDRRRGARLGQRSRAVVRLCTRPEPWEMGLSAAGAISCSRCSRADRIPTSPL